MHNRCLDYHPHLHLVVTAAAINTRQRVLCNKEGNYLFNHTTLAKAFRAKMLADIRKADLKLPDKYPEKWVVDCTWVGSGQTTLVYLGRYLYRGVIQGKDILACKNGQVTFRYQNSKTKQMENRTVSGAEFLRLILQHILPKHYRRARNFDFLHPNNKWVWLVQLTLKRIPVPADTKPRSTTRCKCCGGAMKIIRTRIKPAISWSQTPFVAGRFAV